MSTKLKVAVIGTGMIAHTHARQYADIPEAELAAACDVDEERLRRFAQRYDIKQTYADYDKMVAEADVDAVSVCLPVFLHAPCAITSLRAGKHVLCEKPMASNADEAQAMVDAAGKAGKKLMVYWRRRFAPEARKAREIIESGELGRIYFARTSTLRWRGRPGFDMPAFGKWFMQKDKAGGGTMMDIGGYDLDLVLGLMGFPEVKGVSAAAYQEIDKEEAQAAGVDVEELCVGLIRLADGATIWLESSFAVNVEDDAKALFFGSEAGLKVHPLTVYKHFWFQGRKPTAIEVALPRDPKREGWLSVQEHFVDCCLNDKPIPISSGKEALMVAKVVDALYQSAEAGKEVAFS